MVRIRTILAEHPSVVRDHTVPQRPGGNGGCRPRGAVNIAPRQLLERERDDEGDVLRPIDMGWADRNFGRQRGREAYPDRYQPDAGPDQVRREVWLLGLLRG